LLASVHRGSERLHVEDLWGVDVNLDFNFFQPDEIRRELIEEDLAVERIVRAVSGLRGRNRALLRPRQKARSY